jgi:phosphate transport system permease protein
MSESLQDSIKPWLRASKSLRPMILLVSIIPLPAVMISAYLLKIDPTMSFLTIFFPIQALGAAIIGYRAYGKRGIGDALLVVIVTFLSIFVMVMLLSVLWSVIFQGFQAMSFTFLSQNNVYVSTTTSLEYGGVGHAILGTLLVVAITTLLALPLGIAIAIYLTQSQSKVRGLVRTLTQAISGLPSVVAGLFILSVIATVPFFQRSGLAGSLALFPLMLPTIARVAEEALKLVPVDLRYAALALGAPNYRVFFQVILPAAKSGLITALLLGLARVVGETAPLILTLNANNGTNWNPFEGGLATLPTYIYGYLGSNYTNSQSRAWGAALILLILVGILFGLARILSRSKSLKSKAKK